MAGMRYIALATDYDGTLAAHGAVSPDTLVALERLRASGRKLLLVTGRELSDLQRVCPDLEVFDVVVAENGATLYLPATREEIVLADPPPAALVEGLEARGVTPLSVGRVIVATWVPQEHAVLQLIHELGLELQVVFNKGAVMVLPSGVNKASGLRAALKLLGVSAHNTVGVGDAENDHAFLHICEVAVAVSNALPAVRETADVVTEGARGDGVRELIDRLLGDDLASLGPLARHGIELGRDRDGQSVSFYPGNQLLIAGQSASGKSTVLVALLERMRERHYQFCLIDPEGDHDGVFERVSYLGGAQRVPTVEEVLGLCGQPGGSVSVNLLGLPLADRPAFVADLLPHLAALRSRAGAPHWIVCDEAHHLLPAERSAETMTAGPFHDAVLVTVHPEHVSADALRTIDLVVGVGARGREAIEAFCAAVGRPRPAFDEPEPDEALVYRAGERRAHAVRVTPGRAQHLRHRRKYAQGELGEDKSFFFRGPRGELNLRAQNLFMFLQMGDGVDDATWDFHLRAGDYTRWISEAIKDPELADGVARVAAEPGLDARETRRRVRALIEERYTAPV